MFLLIHFKNKKLQDICSRQVLAVKQLGDIGARKLRARLAELQAAGNVGELVVGNPHPLKGDRLGQFALDIFAGWRLVFEPANDPVPRKTDDSIDWSQVTIVSIEYIGDYHD